MKQKKNLWSVSPCVVCAVVKFETAVLSTTTPKLCQKNSFSKTIFRDKGVCLILQPVHHLLKVVNFFVRTRSRALARAPDFAYFLVRRAAHATIFENFVCFFFFFQKKRKSDLQKEIFCSFPHSWDDEEMSFLSFFPQKKRKSDLQRTNRNGGLQRSRKRGGSKMFCKRL